MKLLDLPAEDIAEVLEHTVVAVGFGRAFRLRLVCKFFDAEVLHAIFATRVIQDYPRDIRRSPGVYAIVSKYLESRSLADLKNNKILTAVIRRAAEALVIKDGIDTKHTRDNNIRALCRAATIHCHPKTVLCLLDSKQDGSSAWKHNEFMKTITKIEDEMDVLVGAAYTGNVERVREILARGADLQGESRFFGYPLQCACSGGHKDIVILLLEHGADVDHGKAPLRYVPSETHHPLNFGTPLQSACLGGHEDIVLMLLEPKYNLSTSHSEYYIAALQAARGGYLNILDFVCTVLNDETFLVSDLESALMRSLREAANRGYHQIVRLILAHGAKVDYRRLWAPFSVASRGGYERVVRLLLEHGRNTTRWPNILVPAASKGQVHIVTFLLESQANLNPGGCGDRAAVAVAEALSEGYESVVRVIVDHGFSLEISGKSSPR